MIAGAALSIGVVLGYDGQLPLVVQDGHFTTLWTRTFMSLVFVLNAGAAVLIAGFRAKRNLLRVCLAAALATSALDGMLNAFVTGRFTLGWYVGKFETLASGWW